MARIASEVRGGIDTIAAELRDTARRAAVPAAGCSQPRSLLPSPHARCSTSRGGALGTAPVGRSAVTIYGSAGTPLAWSGRPSDVPGERLRGPAALFMAPGPIGPRLIYAEPLLNDAAPPARAGTIAAERVLGVAEGGSTAATGAITLPTSFVPVTLRGRYEGAGESPQLYRFLVPDPDGRAAARRAGRPGGACRAAGALPQHGRGARAGGARLRHARRRGTRRGMATRTRDVERAGECLLRAPRAPDHRPRTDGRGRARGLAMARCRATRPGSSICSSAHRSTCSRPEACCWRSWRSRPICSSGDGCARGTGRARGPPSASCSLSPARIWRLALPSRASCSRTIGCWHACWRTRASTRCSSRCIRSSRSGWLSCSASSRCTPPTLWGAVLTLRFAALSWRVSRRAWGRAPRHGRAVAAAGRVSRHSCGRHGALVGHTPTAGRRRGGRGRPDGAGAMGRRRATGTARRRSACSRRSWRWPCPSLVFYPTLVALTQRATERVISETLGPQALAHRAQLQIQLRASLEQIDRLPRLAELVAAQVRTPGEPPRPTRRSASGARPTSRGSGSPRRSSCMRQTARSSAGSR